MEKKDVQKELWLKIKNVRRIGKLTEVLVEGDCTEPYPNWLPVDKDATGEGDAKKVYSEVLKSLDSGHLVLAKIEPFDIMPQKNSQTLSLKVSHLSFQRSDTRLS